jgi:hypothetical protein
MKNNSLNSSYKNDYEIMFIKEKNKSLSSKKNSIRNENCSIFYNQLSSTENARFRAPVTLL